MRGTAWLLLLLILVVGCRGPEGATSGQPFVGTVEQPKTPQAAYALAKAENLERGAAALDELIADLERKIKRDEAQAEESRELARLAADDKSLVEREREVMRSLYEGKAAKLGRRVSNYKELVAAYRLRTAMMRSDAAGQRRNAKVMAAGKIPAP